MYEICEKIGIVKAIQWQDGKNIVECEEAIERYINCTRLYKFEYTTNSGWILKWNGSYKTLHSGDWIITGYRDLLILTDDKIREKYTFI